MYVENLVRLELIYARSATMRRKVMQRQPVNSSNVESIGYNAEEKVLEVEFKSGGIYQYAGVQPAMYADLLAAESVGRFVAQVVRAGRMGLRIEEEKGASLGGERLVLV
jgi:hypothetical protein